MLSGIEYRSYNRTPASIRMADALTSIAALFQYVPAIVRVYLRSSIMNRHAQYPIYTTAGQHIDAPCEFKFLRSLAHHSQIAAIVFYEYAITVGQEIEHIWGRKLSWTTLLFFLNRYLLVTGQIVLLLVQFGWPGLTTKASTSNKFCVNEYTDRI